MDNYSIANNKGAGQKSANPESDQKQPKISLPKGGGAIQGIGEKFQVNPVTGTGSMTIPIAISPGRSEFTPQLSLSYDSGAGNSPFGLGWGVGIPSISRKTNKGIPKYKDDQESDVFLISGAEDLVPVLNDPLPDSSGEYKIKRYRPRIEGLFARIEKWTHQKSKAVFWKSITKDNITTIYGQSKEAQIFHPEDTNAKKIFQWLIEKTFDDKGNIIFYEYKQENLTNIPSSLNEKNRKPSAQKYLKRVYYGNTKPYVSGGISHMEPVWNVWYEQNTWLFELVFDYGEHPEENGAPAYNKIPEDWPSRLDPFSSFRSGLDIRTHRLCRRILMFHHFDELGEDPYLVRSTDLGYDENPIATKLKSITHSSYRKNEEGGFDKAVMPAITFKYSEPKIADRLEIIDTEGLNLPQGIDGNQYRWIDLYGEGLSGILSPDRGAWRYRPNLGNGKFGPMGTVAEIPVVSSLFSPDVQLMDQDGNGLKDLVIRSNTLNGFYELDENNQWKNFQAFSSNPNLEWNDPNLRFIDLTGDGLADILITEDDCFVWSRSIGEEGFDAAQRVHKALDEESGPRIVFNDINQSIYLTDMTGDGLIDIVRIRNGSVCYWANSGYGHFSPKITMENAPYIDHNDQFNQRNIRLADVDGSGTTDLFYLYNDEIVYWPNQSGNSYGKPQVIKNFPKVNNFTTVQIIDLLGKGTAEIVWSSPLSSHENHALKYINLMPQKPHMLIETNNNMGVITRLEYEASTILYREDEKNEKPWITKIPFPVHVLVRQEVIDEISGNSFVTRYAYHHGYFDGVEREFRGFGMVEQWDTEDYRHLYKDEIFTPKGTNWSEETDIPPVYTKTWFHNGAYLNAKPISEQYKSEYFGLDSDAWLLEDTIIPSELSAEEKREAARALKGSMLRQEVYANDDTDLSSNPYTVTESSYDIQCLQSKGKNRHGVFLVTPRESINYHYERNLLDPRIAQILNLKTDHYGNSTHSASIVYPRRIDNNIQEQKQLYVTLTENLLLHPDNKLDWYRHSLPVESRSFEVHGLQVLRDEKNKVQKFEFDDLYTRLYTNFKEEGKNQIDLYPAEEGKILDYATTPGRGKIQLRLLKRSITKYFQNNFSGPSDFGAEVESLAIPYETYSLAFTKGILDQTTGVEGQTEHIRKKITDELLVEGGYIKSPDLLVMDKEEWWIPSGQPLFFYEEEKIDKKILAQRFYLPVGEKSPLGEKQESYIYYDHTSPLKVNSPECYYVFIQEAVDPLGNTIRVTNFDYRVLQPQAALDINQNLTEVAFDIRGMVIATAVMGKGAEGDKLEMYQKLSCNPDEDPLDDIIADPKGHIGHATTWFYYDLFAWQRENQPPFAIGLSRDTHYHDLEDGKHWSVQIAVTYSDGFGREILTKVQAEDGLTPHYDANGNLLKKADGKPEMVDCEDRWVGNGRTIFNNKGKPVRQYEPFFDSNAYFTDEDALVYWGVTPVIHYDPLTRVIRTDFPDGTFSKVEFNPWEQTS
ncbi:MAG: toxin, partial [Bacteroidetes bacterium]|nr:toxin [Bacteroidota bacterium]